MAQATQKRPLRLRVATKIYICVGVLALLFLSSLAGTYYALNNAALTTQQLAEAMHMTRLLGDIDRDAVVLEERASIYSLTGNEAAVGPIRDLGEQLSNDIGEALTTAAGGEQRYRLEQMLTHLGRYLQGFKTMAAERQLRRRIVDEAIVAKAAQIEAPLRQWSSSPAEDEPLAHAAREVLALTAVAENRALRFLYDPDSRLANEGLIALKEAQRLLAEAAATSAAELAEVQRGLDEFQEGFLRAIQATRGYLYLVNVVMAGEAAEFSYQSDQLKEQSSADLRRVTRIALGRTRRFANFAVALSTLAIALGAIAAASLVRTIVGPISGITETFRRLLNQETVESIPGLDRADEIGEMACAAELLKEKSVETELLLTQTEELAAALEAKASQLQKSNEDLDSFAYVASHDLKSPLRAIDNVSHWIAEDAADVLPEQSREHLQLLRARVRRMENLLDDLLAYSQASREGQLSVRVDVADMVQDIRETIDWPRDMTLVIDDSLPVLETDATALHRVLLNLMTNAVKYRGPEAPEVRVSASDEGDCYEFAVADNGVGIAEHYHDAVFQMFNRLHRQSEIEGTGMGLALVQKVVRAHGGDIRLTSEVAVGSTFCFTWPKCMALQESRAAARPALP